MSLLETPESVERKRKDLQNRFFGSWMRNAWNNRLLLFLVPSPDGCEDQRDFKTLIETRTPRVTLFALTTKSSKLYKTLCYNSDLRSIYAYFQTEILHDLSETDIYLWISKLAIRWITYSNMEEPIGQQKMKFYLMMNTRSIIFNTILMTPAEEMDHYFDDALLGMHPPFCFGEKPCNSCLEISEPWHLRLSKVSKLEGIKDFPESDNPLPRFDYWKTTDEWLEFNMLSPLLKFKLKKNNQMTSAERQVHWDSLKMDVRGILEAFHEQGPHHVYTLLLVEHPSIVPTIQNLEELYETESSAKFKIYVGCSKDKEGYRVSHFQKGSTSVVTRSITSTTKAFVLNTKEILDYRRARWLEAFCIEIHKIRSRFPSTFLLDNKLTILNKRSEFSYLYMTTREEVDDAINFLTSKVPIFGFGMHTALENSIFKGAFIPAREVEIPEIFRRQSLSGVSQTPSENDEDECIDEAENFL